MSLLFRSSNPIIQLINCQNGCIDCLLWYVCVREKKRLKIRSIQGKVYKDVCQKFTHSAYFTEQKNLVKIAKSLKTMEIFEMSLMLFMIFLQ